VFDDPIIDQNGTRNHDEIRFWADYVGPGKNRGSYIYDDDGNSGGLKPGSLFVIAGDQNSDPNDGDSIPGSAQLLLDNPRVNDKVTPTSQGGVDCSAAQPGNETHTGDPAEDTADFSEPPFGPGNLRADYVLPSKNLQIRDAGVFWPADADPLMRLTGTGVFGDPVPSSDHRLVWVDVSHGGFPNGSQATSNRTRRDVPAPPGASRLALGCAYRVVTTRKRIQRGARGSFTTPTTNPAPLPITSRAGSIRLGGRSGQTGAFNSSMVSAVRLDVDGQHDDLGELPGTEVVVADYDQCTAPVRERRTERHSLDVVDGNAEIIEGEHLVLRHRCECNRRTADIESIDVQHVGCAVGTAAARRRSEFLRLVHPVRSSS
jgi:hypothetical protein